MGIYGIDICKSLVLIGVKILFPILQASHETVGSQSNSIV